MSSRIFWRGRKDKREIHDEGLFWEWNFPSFKRICCFDQENHKFVQNFSSVFFVIEMCINKVAKNSNYLMKY